MKLRLVAVLLALLMLTGCSNILDKVIKKQGQPTQPAVTTNATNPSQDQTTQSTIQELSIDDIQAALKDAQTVKLVAQDSGQSLAMDKTKREELIKLLADAGELKESKELATLVADPQFPNYQIQIAEKNITLNLYDPLHFGFGDNAPRYFMERGEIWKDLTKWLPPTTYAENQTGSLFKATKVTVQGGSFTDETDVTYAKDAVLRKIRSIDLQRTTLPQDIDDPVTFNFTVNNQKFSLKVYDDYVSYHNFVYKYPQLKQEIESLLSSQ